MQATPDLAPADPVEGLVAGVRIGVVDVVDQEVRRVLAKGVGTRLDRLAVGPAGGTPCRDVASPMIRTRL